MLGSVQQEAMHCSMLQLQVIKERVISMGFDGSLYSLMVVWMNLYIFLFMRGLFIADFEGIVDTYVYHILADNVKG